MAREQSVELYIYAVGRGSRDDIYYAQRIFGGQRKQTCFGSVTSFDRWVEDVRMLWEEKKRSAGALYISSAKSSLFARSHMCIPEYLSTVCGKNSTSHSQRRLSIIYLSFSFIPRPPHLHHSPPLKRLSDMPIRHARLEPPDRSRKCDHTTSPSRSSHQHSPPSPSRK